MIGAFNIHNDFLLIIFDEFHFYFYWSWPQMQPILLHICLSFVILTISLTAYIYMCIYYYIYIILVCLLDFLWVFQIFTVTFFSKETGQQHWKICQCHLSATGRIFECRL